MGKNRREVVVYNGIEFYRYPDSRHEHLSKYFSGTGARVFLHRYTWIYENGQIPEGFHVHHIDGNALNNDISNLECLSTKDHGSKHKFETYSDERKAASLLHLEKIRPLTKAWHASPEGREKHREIGALAYKNFVAVAKPCKHCGTSFLPKAIGNRGYFCTNACKSAWRRAEGLDNIEKTCHCGNKFIDSKYSKIKSCNKQCAGRKTREETLQRLQLGSRTI